MVGIDVLFWAAADATTDRLTSDGDVLVALSEAICASSDVGVDFNIGDLAMVWSKVGFMTPFSGGETSFVGDAGTSADTMLGMSTVMAEVSVTLSNCRYPSSDVGRGDEAVFVLSETVDEEWSLS